LTDTGAARLFFHPAELLWGCFINQDYVVIRIGRDPSFFYQNGEHRFIVNITLLRLSDELAFGLFYEMQESLKL